MVEAPASVRAVWDAASRPAASKIRNATGPAIGLVIENASGVEARPWLGFGQKRTRWPVATGGLASTSGKPVVPGS